MACLLLFSVARADTVTFTPYSAVYKVKISILSGELTARLSRTDTGYRAVHRVAPTGVAHMLVDGAIEESSEFDLTPAGVRPTHYTSSDTITNHKTQADFRFDWPAHTISGVANGETETLEFEGEAHDRVSIQYAMMRDLIVGQTGQSYTLFDIDKFKTLEITLLGTRKVKVPAGSYEAIGIRHNSKGSSRVTTLWCVPELDYIPAIIEQERDGKRVMRAELEEYTAER